MVQPLYSDNVPLSDKDGLLYHYTNFDSLIKILETMTLKSGQLGKMNDFNEASLLGSSIGGNSSLTILVESYLKKEFSAICFTRNYSDAEGNIIQGSNHPPMWTHYADNGNGACIVIDRESLMNKNQNILAQYFYKIEDVNYEPVNAPLIQNSESPTPLTPSEIIHANYKELCFLKYRDWEYEKETRLLIEAPEVYLNIKGSIKYIVLGNRLRSDFGKLDKIAQLMIAPRCPAYKYLSTKTYAMSLRNICGYHTTDGSHCIYGAIRNIINKSETAHEFMQWDKKAT